MTVMNEELKINVKLDTSGVEQGAAKVKSSLKGIESAAGSVSGSTAGATASLEELQGSMRAIAALEFGDIMIENADAIKGFFSSIKESISKSKQSVEGFSDMMDHLRNSADILNPKSSRYEDMAWEGWKKAIGDVKAELKEARDAGISFGKDVGTAFKNLWGDTKKLRTALTALSAVLWPIAGVMSSFSASAMGRDIYNTAQRVGMGTAAYQQWQYIIEQTGADITDLIGAQQTLTEAQIDVAEGSEDIINAFKRIGLSAEEVMAMDRQELFERTVAGLQNIENTTERAAVGYRLLSEDASTLAALLGMSNQQTAELANNYQYLGAIMSEELIGKSLRFQGALANLRAAFQGITNTLAEIFLPVLTAVINGLTKAIAIVNMFLRTLFGLELTTSESGTSSVVGSGINGFGAMTDSIEEAEGAAQKLRRTLMGFDELNVLDSGSSSSSGSSSGGGVGDIGSSIGGGGLSNVGGGLFNVEDLGLDKWKEQIEKWKGIIQTVVPIAMIGFGAVGAVWFLLKGNWAAALACLTLAGIGFAAADSSGLWEKMRDWFEKYNLQIIPIALIGIGAAGAVFFALRGNWVGAMAMATLAGVSLMALSGGDGFSYEEIKGAFEEVKKYAIPLVALAGGIFMGLRGNFVAAAILLGIAGVSGILTYVNDNSMWGDLLTPMKDTWNNIKSWFGTNVKPIFTKKFWDDLFSPIKDGITTKMGEAKTAVVNGWNNVKTYFTTNIAPKFTTTYWSNKFDTIRSGLATKINEARTTVMNGWNNVKTYFTSNIAPKFTSTYWAQKFDTIRAGIATKLGEARTTIMNGWNSIRTYFTTNIAPKLTKAYWTTKFDTFRAALSEKINAAKTVVTNGWNNIKTYFTTNIAPKFTVKYWTTKFNVIKDGAKAAFNGVISIVETAINNIVKKLNTVSFSIPSWVPGGAGGKKFGINLSSVKIPRLATGGIATSSTIANIGENGREAVLPLDHNTQWMDALADKIASRSQGPTKLVLKVGEKELGWASIKGINQITRQTGELQLVL
jgi:hypothetical protein